MTWCSGRWMDGSRKWFSLRLSSRVMFSTRRVGCRVGQRRRTVKALSLLVRLFVSAILSVAGKRINQTCTRGASFSWRTVPRVRPSQGQPPAAGPQTIPETRQGPAWSVGLGCVGGYGPQQRGS